MTETCSNCRFSFTIPWEIDAKAGVDTFCRLNPPEFIPPDSCALKPVRPEGWCGQWAGLAPKLAPNPDLFAKPSVPRKPKKGVAAIV